MNYNPLPAIPRITHAPKKSNHPVGRTVSEIGVILLAYPMIFLRVFIHFYCFHSIHEYSKSIIFITNHNVRVLCHRITLKLSLVP